jgi:hypothetical protein
MFTADGNTIKININGPADELVRDIIPLYADLNTCFS